MVYINSLLLLLYYHKVFSARTKENKRVKEVEEATRVREDAVPTLDSVHCTNPHGSTKGDAYK